MARSRSPAQSSTSASDNEDDDYNRSAYFVPPEGLSMSPARWTSKLHFLPHTREPPSNSPASNLPPELLIHILKNVHSSRDLYSALLVARAWCQCAVELLWYRPSFTRLGTVVKMMRVLSRADQTFVYAQFIRRLNFLYLGNDLSDSLLSRLAPCTRLERLTLINCSNLSDEGLMRVLPCCPNLVALDLTGVTEVTDRSIVALASCTKRLQGINLGNCKRLTDRGILALAEGCPLLRRVKLSNVDLITDEPVSALAKSCPLMLEIDLNGCRNITDVSVRDIWAYSAQMREMRLSQCVELTDAAFPAPPRLLDVLPGVPNPFSTNGPFDKLPPLRLSRPFEHLRMLDLTACSQITDAAIEGIVSVAPKVRNLVLAKCTQLTDVAVENICKLGKHLHYLHLGHAGSITDRSIRSLARSCSRLRYIDLGNCLQLTDMSVFELASLPKLRRIGLVRVSNLTDQAIYALADRHATLERIHLSYCDQITIMAIHFLLQKLPKLTHLSLTGIPAFRRPELQQFCRQPPPDLNSPQRAAFCVYSGKGVAELREFLLDMFQSITDTDNTTATDYDDEYDDYRTRYVEDPETADDDEGEDVEGEDDAPATYAPQPNGHRLIHRPSTIVDDSESRTPSRASLRTLPREHIMTRERGNHPVPRSSGHVSPAWLNAPSSSTVNGVRRSLGFGQQPIVELSTSPTPSEAASNRSGGTNHSHGTAFFRHLTEMPSASRHTVVTPDLVFAEIGHGRGVVPTPSAVLIQGETRRPPDSIMISSPYGAHAYTPPAYTHPSAGASSMTIAASQRTVVPNGPRSPVNDMDGQSEMEEEPRWVLGDSSNSYHRSSAATARMASYRQPGTRSLSSSPTSRDLQASVHSAFGSQPVLVESREHDARGRSVKRSLRNTLTAAEQYASSFFFGRQNGANGHDNAPGPSTDVDSHMH